MMTRYERVRDWGDGRKTRSVFFEAGGDPKNCGYMFQAYNHPSGSALLVFSDRYRAGPEDYFDVPDYMIAAFQAGEPIEPILDYLLEHYADARPWLPGAVRRVCEGGPT